MAWRFTSQTKSKGIGGNLLKLLRYFLSCRKQRVVLNGQHSPWDNVTEAVPLGFYLRLFFIFYLHLFT